MSWALDHPHRSAWRRSEVVSPSGVRAKAAPLGASLSSGLAMLAAAWAAVAVFVGPYFDYRPTSFATWQWTTDNWLLHLIPGAVGAVAGLLAIESARRRRAGTRGPLAIPALLLLAAGIWLVIGPTIWPTFESSAPFASGVSAARDVLNQLGASTGPGLLLAIFGGMALKAAIARPAVAIAEEAAADPTAVDYYQGSPTIGSRSHQPLPSEAPTAASPQVTDDTGTVATPEP